MLEFPIIDDDDARYGVRDKISESDLDFVYNAWCEQILRSRPFRLFSRDEFRAYKTKYLEPCVQRSRLVFACSVDHPEVIYGFACGDKTTLHFAYVKGSFRGRGIGTVLVTTIFPDLGAKDLQHTHHGSCFSQVKDKWRLVYNPFKVLKLAD